MNKTVTFRCIHLLLALLLVAGAASAQVANFSASATSGCAPSVISFNDQSTGNVTSWSWNFGNSATSTLQNPSVSYLTAGTYTVTLTVSGPGGSNTKTNTNYITIVPSPVVSISAGMPAGCPPHFTTFSQSTTLNAPGGGIYLWNFGDGNTSSSGNPSHTYPNSGSYNVSLAVVNSVGCTTSVAQNGLVQVYTPPQISFNASATNLCNAGSSTTFISTVTGSAPFTYAWDFGDGGTSAASSPSHTYGSLGSYAVRLIVTDSHGCKDTLLQNNYITVSPLSPNFTAGNACQNAAVYFTNTTPQPTTTCTWYFGDNTSASGQTAVHNYAAAGTYNVRMVVSNGSCSDSLIKPVTIYPKPVISISHAPVLPCPAPAVIQFSNSTTNAASYTWDFGDGSAQSNQTAPGHTYNSNGFFHVTLVATSNMGCKDSIVYQNMVKVYPLQLSIVATPPEGCIPVNVSFTASPYYNLPISVSNQVYPSPVTSYYWDFGDGTNSSVAAPVHTYSIYGNYTVTLTIATANGCTKTATMIVKAGSPPVANFSASPLNVCVHDPVQFIDSSSVNVTDWEWSFGDGDGSAAQNPIHHYTTPGTKTIKLKVKNNGCADSMTKVAYIQVNFPKAAFNSAYSCEVQGMVIFTNLSQGATSSQWDFGDGSPLSTNTSPQHIYANTGFYQVKLKVFNSATGCHDSLIVPVQIIHLSNSFTASDTTICKGESIYFVASTSGGVPSRYDWIIGNQPFYDTTQIFPYQFNTPGQHTIRLIVFDSHNCPDTVRRLNYITVGHPAISFTATPPYACTPSNVTFTNTTTFPAGTNLASAYWNFGTGGGWVPATALPATHLYSNTGAYTIRLAVTDQLGCSDTLTMIDYINAQHPTASFTTNTQTACAGTPFLFTNASQGVQLTYLWHFGDGGTSTVVSPVHTYQNPGVYTVKLVVKDNIGCKDSVVQTSYITVSPRPNAAFTSSSNFAICPPLIVQFTNQTTGAILYAWSLGNGTSYLQNPGATYTAPGVYPVRLVATNNVGCKDTAVDTIRVLGYAGAFSYSPLLGCAPLNVNFATTMTNVPAFIFDFGDGTTFGTTGQTAQHTYLQPGPYVPKLIMTNNMGCSASSMGLDTIKVDGVYHGFTYSPYPACDKGTFTFTDTSKGAFSSVTQRFWKFHDGTTSTLISPGMYYGAPGTYSVMLATRTSTGCIDTFYSSITVGAIPVIDAGRDTTICAGDTARLQPSGGVAYTWTPAASLVCPGCADPGPHPAVKTVYTVTGKNAAGCASTDTVTVFTKTHTIGVFPPDTSLCAGTSVTLNAGGGNKFRWTPSTGLSNPASGSPVASPVQTVTYTVLVQEAGCIPDTGKVKVEVHPKPDINAGPDQSIIAGNSALINATGSAFITKYEWSPSATLSCAGCATPEATPPATTEYTVIARTAYDCLDTDKVTIYVTCEGSQVFVPNAFTPGAQENEIFYPHGRGITEISSFRIYNRWGEVVFDRQHIAVNDKTQGWDGLYKGSVANGDVFVYTLEAICSNGDMVKWQGDVALIR